MVSSKQMGDKVPPFCKILEMPLVLMLHYVLSGQLPDRSIYWRALLQEIMCDITGVQRGDWQARNDWQVGKIASKCHTFTEYVHKALQKLRLTDVEVCIMSEIYKTESVDIIW